MRGLAFAATFLCAFARARWRWRRGRRAALLAWQQRAMARFMRRRLPSFSYYAAHPADAPAGLPIVDKAIVLDHFERFNSSGVALRQAMGVALKAEASREFRDLLAGQLTVGLSSGTSGRPSVFMVSPRERSLWAGAILGKLLRSRELIRIASPLAPRLVIAFFLRSNSNLYTTIDGARIRFQFFDLLRPMAQLLAELQSVAPDILVAPASVLGSIARANLAAAIQVRPSHVVSVAETLEAEDRAAIEAAWNVAPDQVYQAAEGLLGASCEAGRIHLNEEFVHIEPEWIDTHRFVPIITDFSRITQAIVRYRLDDVLVAAPDACPCGRPTLSLLAIEGRCDDVLWLPGVADGEALCPVYPDALRRAMALAMADGTAFDDYRLVQTLDALEVQLRGSDGHAAVRASLDRLWRSAGVRAPRVVFHPWTNPAAGTKRRRIRRAGPRPGAAWPSPTGTLETSA